MEKLGVLSNYQGYRTTRLWPQFALVASGITIFLFFTNFYNIDVDIRISKQHDARSSTKVRDIRCKPHLPSTLTRLHPLVSSSHPFRNAISKLDQVLEERVKEDDMDSLVMGVIGPEGLLWSKGYGVANANDTNSSQPPDEHSIYRVASISKLFAALETFILRDRGLLSW
jgi:CubicO group peptidase (beta-lactamase class C family)